MNRPIEITIKIDSLSDSKLLEIFEALKEKIEEINASEKNSTKIEETVSKNTPSVKEVDDAFESHKNAIKQAKIAQKSMVKDTIDTRPEEDKSENHKNDIKQKNTTQEYDNLAKFAKYLKSQQELMTNPLFWKLVDKNLKHLKGKSNEAMTFGEMFSDDLNKFIKFAWDVKNNGEFWKLFEENPENLKNELKDNIAYSTMNGLRHY